MADSGGHDFRMQKHAPPPSTTENDPWEEVKDPQTGDIYWWNTETDETTAVGLLQQIHPTHFFFLVSDLIHCNVGRRTETGTGGPAAAERRSWTSSQGGISIWDRQCNCTQCDW